ncbi:MAG: choice-of-anchor tandem repeat GloVer-containing protein, partial [Terriglobales bacterium]
MKRLRISTFAVLVLVSLTVLFASSAAQQYTETVPYTFTGGSDGALPISGLAMDSSGNLYGTTLEGGNSSTACGITSVPGCGVVFKLSPVAGGGWTRTVLYTFTGGSDGALPFAGVVLDSAGNLYGTTLLGGNSTATNCVGNIDGSGFPPGCGVVFKLTPSSSTPWTETVLYAFTGSSDGLGPFSGVVFDSSGNLYGETALGGNTSASCALGKTALQLGCGVVFKLTPKSSAPWTESILYTFGGGSDGGAPERGLTLDSAGNLYGATFEGGNTTVSCNPSVANQGCGVVFKLAAGASVPWTESVLYTFQNGADGGSPGSGVIFDAFGNLYGIAATGGNLTGTNCNPGSAGDGCGVVYKLAPTSSGPWTESALYTFTGEADGLYTSHDAGTTASSLVFDALGNLYGNAPAGGDVSLTCHNRQEGCGTIYQLSPSASGPWTESILYAFAGGTSGGYPGGSILRDSRGNIFGGTWQDGNTSDCTENNSGAGCGVIYEVSPNSATTLTSSLNPSTSGQPVTFTATVTGSSPTGTVVFTSNGTAVSGCSSVALASGKAQCTTSALPVGSDLIQATYSGDSNNGSSSATLTQVVNSSGKTTTTTVLVSSLNPSTVGDSVTFTATVSPAGPPTPTGTVVFTSNGAAISGCTAVSLSSAQIAT